MWEGEVGGVQRCGRERWEECEGVVWKGGKSVEVWCGRCGSSVEVWEEGRKEVYSQWERRLQDHLPLSPAVATTMSPGEAAKPLMFWRASFGMTTIPSIP